MSNFEQPSKKTSPQSSFKKDQKGKITDHIGTGDNAKNSIVYLCIQYSFWGAGVLSLLLTINGWCFRENEKVPNIIADYKMIWDAFIPIITLALGYALGKSQK